MTRIEKVCDRPAKSKKGMKMRFNNKHIAKTKFVFIVEELNDSQMDNDILKGCDSSTHLSPTT